MREEAASRTTPGWIPTDLFPFESRFVGIEGHRIHYVDEGSGPTLLLLHGNPTWSFLYRDIIRRLKAHMRCVAIDYPGFGLSQAAEGYDYRPASHAKVVEAFVDSLGIGKFFIMVQDWGGPIGLWVAARRASQVQGLIIGNTWAWPIDGDRHFERFSDLIGGPIGRVLIRHFNAFVNVMVPMNVKGRRLSSKVMAAYRGPFPAKEDRMPTWIFPREIRRSREFLAEVEAGLAKLAAKPALILWGDRDIAFRTKERKRFERTFPAHRTLILEGAGHYIQEAAPDEISEAIMEWSALGA